MKKNPQTWNTGVMGIWYEVGWLLSWNCKEYPCTSQTYRWKDIVWPTPDSQLWLVPYSHGELPLVLLCDTYSGHWERDRNIWHVAPASCLKDLVPHRWPLKHVAQSWQTMPFLVTLQRTQLKTFPFLSRKQGQLKACRYPPKANILQKLNSIRYLCQGVAEVYFQPTSSLPPPGKTRTLLLSCP